MRYIMMTMLLLTGLTACVHRQALPLAQTPPISHVSELKAWTLAGAIAAKSTEKTWAATLHWQETNPQSYQIRLFGPLGSGSILIQQQGTHVTYTDATRQLTATDASQLLYRHMRIRLPVNYLHDWIKGLPALGPYRIISRTKHERIRAFEQAGYQVRYLEWTHQQALHLPRKIVITGHGLWIKVIIKRWKI